MLYGLVYGVHLGIGGPQRELALLMTLSSNGQAITLSRRLSAAGVTSGERLRTWLQFHPGEHLFAQTFPTGNHALWLNYWLAAQGIDPLRDVQSTVIPPMRMVAHLAAGEILGFCAGGPWNAHAIDRRAGFTVATSQEIWPDHPEKVLGTTATFVRDNPNSARALIMALLEASRFLDIRGNRPAVAARLATEDYLATSREVIEPRFLGHYNDGLGRQWEDPHALRFHDEGQVNFPWISDALWFLTQMRRWGLLKAGQPFADIPAAVNQVGLYREAAQQVGVALPAGVSRRVRLIDGAVWDGSAVEPVQA